MGIRKNLIDFIHKSATGSKKARTILTPVGAGVFAFFITLLILCSVLLDNYFNLPVIHFSKINYHLTIPFLMVGIFMTGWSVFHFIKEKGTPVPLNPPSELIVKGPYVYTRNPMLTGIFFIMFGAGLLFESFSLTFIFTPIFIAANVLELKWIEEPELEMRFGSTYSEYKKQTPMFIPGLYLFRGKIRQ